MSIWSTGYRGDALRSGVVELGAMSCRWSRWEIPRVFSSCVCWAFSHGHCINCSRVFHRCFLLRMCRLGLLCWDQVYSFPFLLPLYFLLMLWCLPFLNQRCHFKRDWNERRHFLRCNWFLSWCLYLGVPFASWWLSHPELFSAVVFQRLLVSLSLGFAVVLIDGFIFEI